MPDIPGVQPAENLIALGQGLMKVGSAIGGLGDEGQSPGQDGVAKAYQDAEVARETMLARNYIDDQYNQLTVGLQANPEHDQFGKLYEDKNVEVSNGVQQFIKLPEVQTNVDNYLAVKRNEVGKSVFTLARDKLANETEQVGQQSLNDAVATGDVKKVMEVRDLLLSRGVISAAQATAVTENDIPKAKYNNIFAQLLPLDQVTRMSILDAPDAMVKTGLTQDQVDAMAKAFTDRQTRIDAAAKREADIANSTLELQASDKLIQYMQGGLKEAGFDSTDKLYAYVGGLQWQGQDAGRLQKYWADAFDSAVTGRATFKDPVKEARGWEIVFDVSHGWTLTERQTQLRNAGVLNNGVPGPEFQQMLNAMQSNENNSDQMAYMQPLKDYYNSQLAALESKVGNEAKMQEIAYKKAVAISTVYDFMLNNPKNENNIWQTKIDELMSSDITKDVRKRVEEKLGEWFAPATPPAVVLNVALEQFPELATNAKFMAEYQAGAIAGGELEKAERAVLAQAGITNIKAAKQAPNGDLNYQTADGTIYRVVGRVVNRRIHNVVEKYVNGAWRTP